MTDNKISKITENKEVPAIQERSSSSEQDFWQRDHREKLIEKAKRDVDDKIGAIITKYVIDNKYILFEPEDAVKQNKIKKLKEDIKGIVENTFIGYTNIGTHIIDNHKTTVNNAKIKFLDDILRDNNKLERLANGAIKYVTENFDQL